MSLKINLQLDHLDIQQKTTTDSPYLDELDRYFSSQFEALMQKAQQTQDQDTSTENKEILYLAPAQGGSSNSPTAVGYEPPVTSATSLLKSLLSLRR